MKVYLLLLTLCLSACNGGMSDNASADQPDSAEHQPVPADSLSDDNRTQKAYANERFKDVTVEKVGADKFMIQGRGQIFEANFGWVVEDGHRELKNGFQMTDAGAPEWGKFRFFVEVQKDRPNSTLTLVLFESSARDGSRQYELAVPLE